MFLCYFCYQRKDGVNSILECSHDCKSGNIFCIVYIFLCFAVGVFDFSDERRKKCLSKCERKILIESMCKVKLDVQLIRNI